MNELLESLTTVNNICQTANEHYTQAGEYEKELTLLASKQKNLKIKWILIAVIASYVGFAVFGVIASVFEKIPVVGKFLSMVLLIGGSIAGGALAVLVCLKLYRDEKDKLTDAASQAQANLEAEQAAAQQLYDDNTEVLSILPVDYWYPLATDYILKIVQSGRAGTVAEALDKFDEQLHRWKLEEANAQVVALQEQQTAHLASVRRSSKITAAASVATAAISFASAVGRSLDRR